MNSHIGKMRNVFGELQQQKIENIKSSESTSEGFIADANNKYLAVIKKALIEIKNRFLGLPAVVELLLCWNLINMAELTLIFL